MLRLALAPVLLLSGCDRLLPFPAGHSPPIDSSPSTELRPADRSGPMERWLSDGSRGDRRWDGQRDGSKQDGSKQDNRFTADGLVCPASCTTCDPAAKSCVLNAATCAAGCTCPKGWGCTVTVLAGTGLIYCDDASSCTVTCSGSACLIFCNGAGSCKAPITCSGPGLCSIMCQGDGACSQPLVCKGPGKCAVSCTALGCSGGIDCSAACSCDATCFMCSSTYPTGPVLCSSCFRVPWGCAGGTGCGCQ
jgi:hypothetical protein